MFIWFPTDLKLQLQIWWQTVISRAEQTNIRQITHCSRVQWRRLCPVSNLHSSREKPFRVAARSTSSSQTLSQPNDLFKSDVNVPDTRTRKLRRASHCQKSLQSTQPFCIVTHESGSFILIINALTLGLKVLRNH